MAIKLRNEYGPVLHMPTSKENLKEKVPQSASDSYGHKQVPLPIKVSVALSEMLGFKCEF